MLQNIVFIGGAVHLYGTWRYLQDTLFGTTKPNRVSFVLWSAAPLIGGFAALSEGASLALIPVFLAGIGPLIILIASYKNKNAYWKLRPFDYACGFFSVLALVLWFITKQPVVAVIFAIISDALATAPTVVKSWTHPHTETAISYTTSLFSSLTAFTAISLFTFTELAFPVYIVISNASILFAIYHKKLRL
jgi:hypothetical protein